jgi:uncharacterized protein YbjT (DUF2867 family)
MPVIVVGADTPLGLAVIDAVLEPDREVRAFVSDPEVGAGLKARGVKVALGDVSDASHVAGACTNAFSAVLVGEAAGDGREVAFASSPAAVWEAWAEAVSEAAVTRVIWVLDGDGEPPPSGAPETALVGASGRSTAEVAAEVAHLDDAAQLPPPQR